MSATMNWASSGLGTKTGTTNQLFLDDLDTLMTSKSGDATFKWEVAGKNSGSTPRWLLFRRKDLSVGRIAVIIWDSAPAANNAAILDGAPAANAIQIANFPVGTANTLSNLTAASGTICGDDTGAVKCMSPGTVSNAYAALFQHYYFDDTEALVFCTQNPAAATTYGFSAGKVIVDGNDDAYEATHANTGANRWDAMGSSSTSFMPWTTTAIAAGTVGSGVRTNYGSANRTYYAESQPSGQWAGVAVGLSDIMSDSTLNKNWYTVHRLLSNSVKGEGPVLRFRQIGIGSGSTAAFQPYSTTGPVVQARHAHAQPGGNTTGAPWMLNFKL